MCTPASAIISIPLPPFAPKSPARSQQSKTQQEELDLRIYRSTEANSIHEGRSELLGSGIHGSPVYFGAGANIPAEPLLGQGLGPACGGHLMPSVAELGATSRKCKAMSSFEIALYKLYQCRTSSLPTASIESLEQSRRPPRRGIMLASTFFNGEQGLTLLSSEQAHERGIPFEASPFEVQKQKLIFERADLAQFKLPLPRSEGDYLELGLQSSVEGFNPEADSDIQKSIPVPNHPSDGPCQSEPFAPHEDESGPFKRRKQAAGKAALKQSLFSADPPSLGEESLSAEPSPQKLQQFNPLQANSPQIQLPTEEAADEDPSWQPVKVGKLQKLIGAKPKVAKKPRAEKPMENYNEPVPISQLTRKFQLASETGSSAILAILEPDAEVEVIWGVPLNELPIATNPVKYCVPNTSEYRIYRFRNPQTQRWQKLMGCFHHDGCRKQFNKWHNFYDHLRSHTKEKPFVCPLEGCGQTFAQKTNLNKHLDAHGSRPSKETLGKRRRPATLEQILGN